MKLKYTIPLLCLSVITLVDLHGQTIDDALIFSREDLGASARVKGFGNVQTALGGDISSLNGNPAGLGFFGRSDISITFNYLQNSNNIGYLGTNTTSQKGNFGVDQAGAVFHFPTRSNSGWQNFNIGLSYNKTQNFNNARNYEGNNNTSTIVHALTDIMDADQGFSDDFYWSNIVEIYDIPDRSGFFPLAVENGSKEQYNEHSIRGNRSKTAIAFGANYNHQFYIGATLGITSFKYDRQTQFIENGRTKSPADVEANNPNSIFIDPDNLEYDYLNASYELFDTFSQITEGSGVDFKLGMIYKPAVDWNIGVTINTPTWTTIKEDTRAYTDVNFYEDDKPETSPFDTYESKEYDSGTDFALTTPWKFALGVAKFFNRGLLSADVEFVDYSSMRYGDPSTDYFADNTYYSDINRDIKDSYTSVVNFKIGGEYLINNILSGRAGFNYYGNPYKDADEKNFSGSLGLGVKLNSSLYLDMAVSQQFISYKEAAYMIDESFWNLPSPVANIDHRRTNVALTFGAKF